MTCKINNNIESIEFVIVDGECFRPILGLQACVKLDLIQRKYCVNEILNFIENKEQFIEKYKKLFNGCGRIPGLQTICIRPNSIPKINYRKKIPFAIHEKLKQTLITMEREHIIEKVNYPTDWINNIMIVEKPNGDMRLCLDPKPLNECIQREHYIIPTVEDLVSRLSGKSVFTVIDMKNGFWQLQLDKPSSKLTTFNTPFGRYKFLRMPFGINCAPEIFQRRNVEIFGDIENVEIYFDDMIISGKDEESHDHTLVEVMNRAEAYNVRFNPDKLQFKKSSVSFMGHVISKNGIKPEDKHVKAIVEMPTPSNKQELMRFLGVLKFLSKFIPNLTKLTTNLRELLKPNSVWNWTEQHSIECSKLCSILTRNPILNIFNSSNPIVIQTEMRRKMGWVVS